MGNRRVVWGWLFYGGLTVVLLGVLFKLWPEVLPHGIAMRIGHNSEAYLMALVLAAWIQFARPKLVGTRHEWLWTVVAALAMLVIGLVLLDTYQTGYHFTGASWRISVHLESRYRTLNEAFLALAILIPYVQWRRPISEKVAVGIAVVLLIAVIVGNRTAAITDLAETLGILVLAPIGFDLADKAILAPEVRTSTILRWSWYLFLVVVPVAISAVEPHVDLGDLVGESLRYAIRITEAFLAMLLVEVYFALCLGRTGPRDDAGAEPVASPAT